MEKELLKKLFLLGLLIVFVFLVVSPFMGTGPDDGAHREMALNPCYSINYDSWFRFAAKDFAGNDFLWQIMGFVIVGLLSPIVLYLITKNWWVFFFYFFGSNYFLVLWGAGIYPQALVGFFGLLLVLCRKSWWQQGIVFIVGIGVHGFAPILLSVIWGLLLLQRLMPLAWGKLSLACSPIFGQNSPTTLQNTLGANFEGNHNVTFQEIGSFFLKMCPLPFIIVAFKEWVNKKEWWPFALLAFLFAGAVIQANERVLWTFAPFMWLGFIPYFEKSPHKKRWIYLALGIGIINFVLFVRLKTGSGC